MMTLTLQPPAFLLFVPLALGGVSSIFSGFLADAEIFRFIKGSSSEETSEATKEEDISTINFVPFALKAYNVLS